VAGKDGDLLQHFEDTFKKENLPSVEELRNTSRLLFRRYGHPHAFERALSGKFPDQDRTIRTGDIWDFPLRDEPLTHLAEKKAKSKKGKKKTDNDDHEDDEVSPPFMGDQSLAQSCRFLYDVSISREVLNAISDGDVGRVWEAIKVCIS